MPYQSVEIKLGVRSYDICIGGGLIGELSKFECFSNIKHAVVLTDSNVARHYLDSTIEHFSATDVRVDSIVVEAGETSKSVTQLESIWNRLLKFRTDRKSTIVALGGGVVGDLAGFAAATFARGIDFIQIPTSLLAQVDSSVGGKTGINLPGSKNMVGAFWQPKFVLIDPKVLSTLDNENYSAGLAEVIKYGVIMDADFFGFLSDNVEGILNRETSILGQVVARSCQLKAQVVQEDELETTGRRAILNYGHTFGHAIENVFGYGEYLHGQAIAIGMHCAARLACKLGQVDDDFVVKQKNLTEKLGLPTRLETSGRERELVAAMHRDKKVMDGQLKLVLPQKIGHVEVCDAPDDDVLFEIFRQD